jgi:hypothetical protein
LNFEELLSFFKIALKKFNGFFTIGSIRILKLSSLQL